MKKNEVGMGQITLPAKWVILALVAFLGGTQGIEQLTGVDPMSAEVSETRLGAIETSIVELETVVDLRLNSLEQRYEALETGIDRLLSAAPADPVVNAAFEPSNSGSEGEFAYMVNETQYSGRTFFRMNDGFDGYHRLTYYEDNYAEYAKNDETKAVKYVNLVHFRSGETPHAI